MPVYSMTGFASGRHPLAEDRSGATAQNAELTLELRSVNSRFLDFAFHLQDELRFSEPALRRLLSARLQRGKVEIRAGIRRQAGHELTPPAPVLLQQIAQIQTAIQTSISGAAAFSAAEVLQLSSGNAALERSQLEPPLLTLAQSVTDQLLQARAQEGGRLQGLLLARCDSLQALATRAAPLVPAAVATQKERFLARWQQALTDAGGGTVATDAAQERALAEAAAFALRIDVAEELDRLGAHLTEIRDLLKKGGTLGKRLGFLIQELHREANTLGAKSASLELSRISVDMKVLIEQMREQVQNVE